MAFADRLNPDCSCCGDGPPVIIQPTGCPCTTAPASLTMTVTYGPGKTSADYSDQIQSTTFTYMISPPPWVLGVSNRYFSPLIPSPLFGFNVWYTLACLPGTGSYGLGQGDDSIGPVVPFAFANFDLASVGASCSPFLLPEIGSPTTTNVINFVADGGTAVIS